nr:Os07g0648050 [Ipomoea trifida]
MMVMNQKSVLPRVMAKPPRRTTVAQMKPSVPSPVAAFSNTASLSAKRVNFFSGAPISAAEAEFARLALFFDSMLLCASILAFSSEIWTQKLPNSLSADDRRSICSRKPII